MLGAQVSGVSSQGQDTPSVVHSRHAMQRLSESSGAYTACFTCTGTSPLETHWTDTAHEHRLSGAAHLKAVGLLLEISTNGDAAAALCLHNLLRLLCRVSKQNMLHHILLEQDAVQAANERASHRPPPRSPASSSVSPAWGAAAIRAPLAQCEWRLPFVQDRCNHRRMQFSSSIPLCSAQCKVFW